MPGIGLEAKCGVGTAVPVVHRLSYLNVERKRREILGFVHLEFKGEGNSPGGRGRFLRGR